MPLSDKHFEYAWQALLAHAHASRTHFVPFVVPAGKTAHLNIGVQTRLSTISVEATLTVTADSLYCFSITETSITDTF